MIIPNQHNQVEANTTLNLQSKKCLCLPVKGQGATTQYKVLIKHNIFSIITSILLSQIYSTSHYVVVNS